MQRDEIFEAINTERDTQDVYWSHNEARRRSMYSTVPPHILLLEAQISKLRDDWYATPGGRGCFSRFIKVAAIAVRALEEIVPYE
jgi:hypothetical protein